MRHVLCVAALAVAASSSASGAIFHWDWDRGGPGTSGLNDAGGRFESITATFDDVTDRLQWSMTFSDQITNGFFLALNNGPNPKGHAGELALLYVDARVHSDVVLTAYGYNGLNSISSYVDGNGAVAGNQPADVIKNTLDRASWVLDAGVIDSSGKRTIFIDIDATELIERTPLYPDPIDPYYGIGFGAKLGLWLHTFRQFDVSYGPSGTITNIASGGEGWFDGTNLNTIPTPGAATIGLISLAAMIRRRRA